LNAHDLCHDARPMIPRLLLRWLGVSLVTALCLSCTQEPPAPTQPSPEPPVGELLTLTGTQDGSSLVRYRFSDGSAETFPAPIDPEAVNRATITGATTPDGSFFLAVNGGVAQVYRLAAGSQDPVALGPPLPVHQKEPMLAIGDTAAVVADCKAVHVLAMPDARRWTTVGRGCWAAVSLDGGALVTSTDGRTVVQRSATSRRPDEVLFDVRDLVPSLGSVGGPPRLVGTPAWSSAGLAFLVRAGDQLAVFVRNAAGEMTEVLQEQYANVYRVPHLAWQPNGSMLAISDDVSPSGAVLRVFDASAGELRAVSLAPVGFVGAVWAPDGSSIALLTGGEKLVVVRLDGTWLLRRDTEWKALLGWSVAG
jgi:hypothetical protein